MDDEFDYQNLENDDENQIESGRKKIEMTTYHKNKIKETIKKMEDNLIQPQYSVGRVFTGPGFASKPDKIIYKDFEVGTAMNITIELTNISYSFNSFKLLPLDDEIIDFFEIDYRPCGRVPAGISTTITLKFTPMVDKDYFSHIKLLSETGMVLVPIECLSKKCVITIINPAIDYGDVILGQEIYKTISIENTGALACKFSFLDDNKNILIDTIVEESALSSTNEVQTNYEDFIERKIVVNKNNYLSDRNLKKYFLKQINYPSRGNIEPYSEKKITFILNSKYLGDYELNMNFKIEYKKNIEYKPILIKFKVIDLPVFTQNKIYSLNYLIQGHIFREKLTLFNNSNISYKLQIYNHKDLNDFVELNPNLGYIQSNSSFDIWIKLKIGETISNLNKFFKSDNKDEYKIPLKISITNISIPLIVILNFNVTKDDLKLSKSFLNFDKCFTDQSNKIQVAMENNCLLPMEYGYIMLPKEFQVKNNIDNILSNEKIFCDIF